ncbi:hypothetical protein CEP51_000398 [Fusarium floridanum]|uniref:Uncharacterized protein n=1 Tax=Fusarium floridanum TaxID=1325733 RepID=A0A428SN12_9HYPO|nr:hypothetical protein CEP51_000398 [Fusarium floridanum]
MAAAADDDARTTYSNVTNEDHVQTRDFVYELANDIYGKLKLLMSPDDWPLISKSLPELLKAFAIRIGSDGASQASRDVMYFIHKEHWNIANQFKNLLLGMIDDGDASRVNTDTDIMSLQDKMDMWDENISMHESAPEKGELFQNVTDDDPNITASLLYNKMVLESKDYSWLVQRLETELSLERGETDPRSDDVPIRQQILSMLPPGNISKRRRPTHQDVVFQFPSRPIRFLPSDPILVTPSSHNIQLTNILTYFNQTWPSFGEEVLSFVSRAFGHPHFTATTDSMTLGNDARINALFDSSFSLIRVTGPAYSVSEFGEQLAWLAAATSNPPHSTDNRVIFNKPLVTYLGNHVEDSYPPQLGAPGFQWRRFTMLETLNQSNGKLEVENTSPASSSTLSYSLTGGMFLELSKKSKGTTEEQWYAIWEILFPEERRPLSIYVDSDQSPDFVLLREFSQRQGVSILHERIRATGRILRSDVSEQEVVNTLGQALDSLFEYYRLGQDSVQPVPSQTESWSLNTSTPQGGTVDHGSTGSRAVVASHYSHGSNGDDLATTATPDQNNAVTPTTDPFMEYQPDPVEPLQVLEVLDTDMPAGGWGPLGEMESFIGGENWDELCNRIIAKGEIPGFDTGVGGGM